MKYVTSNTGKFQEALEILHPLKLEQVPLDIQEIQGSSEEVIREKIRQALASVPPPFLIEDVCLFCPALGGLPGPYVKDFLTSLGVLGFAQLLDKYDDKSAAILCTVAYVKSPEEILLIQGEVEGLVVLPKRADREMKWQDFFIPEGFEKTFGEMEKEVYNRLSARGKALADLKNLHL